MPRKYKPDPLAKRYRKYDVATVKKALEEYMLTPNCSVTSIASKYNISKSVFYRRCKQQTVNKQGGQTAIDEDAETHIVRYLNVCSDWGYPLDLYDLRYIVKMYLDRMRIKIKRFKNNMPGTDFANNFLKRHAAELSSRLRENIKKSRAKVSSDTIIEYFEQLQISLKVIDPQNIVSYDEMNVSDDPARKEIIVKRKAKYPDRTLNPFKPAISITLAGTAAGELLPPYVIYKANDVFDTWITGGPKGTRYNWTTSGWIDGNTFEDYVKTIIIPFFRGKTGRKVLIGDILSSHLSVEVIKICEEQDISFVFLPPDSAYLTQPLDIAFFNYMQIVWRDILLKWKITDGRSQVLLPKGHFPKLLKELISILSENGESNIKAGFHTAGIVPMDPEQVLSRLPKGNLKDPETLRPVMDKSALDILTEMTYGTMNINELPYKREMVSETGGSLENIDEDILHTNQSDENKADSVEAEVKKDIPNEITILFVE